MFLFYNFNYINTWVGMSKWVNPAHTSYSQRVALKKGSVQSGSLFGESKILQLGLAHHGFVG